jgi:cytochrome b
MALGRRRTNAGTFPEIPMPQPPDALPADSAPRLLWDWPTRILHWAMAALFTTAFSVAVVSSEHGRAFPTHAALGLLLGLAVLLRLVWGLVGSSPSRFASFLHGPGSLVRYFREVLAGRDQPVAGHNPGSSYAIYALLLLPLGLAGSGIAMGRGLEGAEEVHAVLAYAMVAVIAAHILGVAWHTFRHGEAIAMSMVHGRRRLVPEAAIPSARPFTAAAFLLVLGGGAATLWQGLDLQKRTLTLPGLAAPLNLGEREGGGAPQGEPEEDHD